jgi:hypothetical protein
MWHALNDPVYEPVKRNKDGVRWISHRFPIRGGISMREVMLRDLASWPLDPLWQRFARKSHAA